MNTLQKLKKTHNKTSSIYLAQIENHAKRPINPINVLWIFSTGPWIHQNPSLFQGGIIGFWHLAFEKTVWGDKGEISTRKLKKNQEKIRKTMKTIVFPYLFVVFCSPLVSPPLFPSLFSIFSVSGPSSSSFFWGVVESKRKSWLVYMPFRVFLSLFGFSKMFFLFSLVFLVLLRFFLWVC